jgi:ubiquinone/menaquinone biosynthesis C-methylase UbiE
MWVDIAGFSSLDRRDDSRALVGLMDVMETNPGVQESRRIALEALRLRAGDRVLDVGCGTGGAVPLLAERVGSSGEIVGVDASEMMVGVALERHRGAGPVRFQTADARDLPFAEASFDACRTERMLSHVGDPAAALTEMARVTRAGGRISAIDVDLEALMVDSTDPGLGRIAAIAATDHVQSARVARHLVVLFREAGLAAVSRKGVIVRLPLEVVRTTFADVLRELESSGAVDHRRVERWWGELEELDRVGHFFAYVPYFVVAGIRS